MAYELRDGSGSLFRNEKKQEGERTPDYRGDAMVNGKRVEIAAWVKEAASVAWIGERIEKVQQ